MKSPSTQLFKSARPEFAFSTVFQWERSKFKYSDFSSSEENVARSLGLYQPRELRPSCPQVTHPHRGHLSSAHSKTCRCQVPPAPFLPWSITLFHALFGEVSLSRYCCHCPNRLRFAWEPDVHPLTGRRCLVSRALEDAAAQWSVAWGPPAKTAVLCCCRRAVSLGT